MSNSHTRTVTYAPSDEMFGAAQDRLNRAKKKLARLDEQERRRMASRRR